MLPPGRLATSLAVQRSPRAGLLPHRTRVPCPALPLHRWVGTYYPALRITRWHYPPASPPQAIPHLPNLTFLPGLSTRSTTQPTCSPRRGRSTFSSITIPCTPLRT